MSTCALPFIYFFILLLFIYSLFILWYVQEDLKVKSNFVKWKPLLKVYNPRPKKKQQKHKTNELKQTLVGE